MTDNSRLTFIVRHEAWYWNQAIENPTQKSITVQREARDDDGYHDGCVWEFLIDWEYIGRDLTPQVRMWEDSWAAFAETAEFFGRLAQLHGTSPSPEDVVDVLRQLDFFDLTERTMRDRAH